MILLCKFYNQIFPDDHRSVLGRLTISSVRGEITYRKFGPGTGHRTARTTSATMFRSKGFKNIFSYAEEGLGVDGVSGTAAGIEFSSSFDFCYQQCMGKISEDSTFEPCEH